MTPIQRLSKVECCSSGSFCRPTNVCAITATERINACSTGVTFVTISFPEPDDKVSMTDSPKELRGQPSDTIRVLPTLDIRPLWYHHATRINRTILLLMSLALPRVVPYQEVE
jgi:hypothetical protein